MDGIKLLLLLVASAQVEVGNERDYGWQINDKDNVLEYIIQITPDKKRAMEIPSAAYPAGAENTSNMPPELVGRASRVVVKFGTEILPRVPSLQELERTPRLYDQPNINAAAVLGDDGFRNLEPVRNIQGQGTTPPAFPASPNGLANNPGQLGSVTDLNENLSDALPTSRAPNSTMPGRSSPDPGLLAQNMTNQSAGAGSFLDQARGVGSRITSTAPAANGQLNSATNPPATTPSGLPDFPPTTNPNSPFASSNPPSASTNNRNSPLANSMGASNTTAPLYPADRFNPPSLGGQSTLPQQRTPSSTFGTSPGLVNSPNELGTNTQNPTHYPPAMSQPNDRYNYGPQTNLPQGYTSAPNPSGYQNQNPTLIASNTAPYTQPNNSIPSNQTTGGGQSRGLTNKQLEDALAIQTKLDKDKNGVLTEEEYTPAGVDGILLTLFVVSLLVNLYLGHLIRKLLMRYRLVLTNVRSQTAYT